MTADKHAGAWISVGELAEGFSRQSNALSPVPTLAGATIELAFENGDLDRYAFISANRLRWSFRHGDRVEQRGESAYQATSIRQNVYFVDFVTTESAATSVSLVLDLGRDVATRVLGWLPAEEAARESLLSRAQRGQDLTTVSAELSAASIGAVFNPAASHHPTTSDLVGLRARYSYSPTELYEHIYLSPQRYVWHCLLGGECGLADVDRCDYRKIGDRLYLFVWREKIVPTLGVILVDLNVLKTTGKIFGYQDDMLSVLANFRIGARVSIANRTASPV